MRNHKLIKKVKENQEKMRTPTHQFRSLMISTQVDNKLKNKNQSKINKIGNNLNYWAP